MPRRLLAITSLILLLSGCGQKGPLYLPQAPQAPQAAPADTADAPAPSKDDKDAQ
ncbi:hypothetical protein EZI54_05005 [Marinobacter halodurans]|uniref:Lipoprotein n=1 Tax=Marinobacter halodurans TaxID=2528979 RepID=A0ABY1ZRB5_9GAMM|nr:lipoprotein [Marinobacter halodurans]TBW58211.1 hypothetical protein EZI54_05005 [Marinobacter halodurans]